MDKLLENDPELASFVNQIEQSQRLKQVTNKLTNECWDLCVTNPNVSKFDSKTESCLVNCIERFLDVNAYMVNQLSSKLTEPSFGSSTSSSSSLQGFVNEPEMELDVNKSFGSTSSGEEPKKSGGWKFW
jgi:import inner membrane translocase subunit TIM8